MLQIIYAQLPLFGEGLAVTLALTVTSVSVGIVGGLLLATMQLYAGRAGAFLANAASVFLRSIPEVVLLFGFYFGLSQAYDFTPFAAATFALGLRSAGYQSQIFLSAMIAVPEAQMVAGRAIGMSSIQTFVHIRLMQALRHALIPWANELSAAFKLTSLAYLIGVVDIMRQTKYIIGIMPGDVLTILVLISCVYLSVNWIINKAIERIDRRLRTPGFHIFSGEHI